MNPDYDPIADAYQKSKETPRAVHVERFSFFDVLGDVRGQSVLDLACGEGYLTRQIRARGAARVVGVDLSERMIALARQQESRQPLGIEYRVDDAKVMQLGEPFDVVTAGYLLNHARSYDELLQMCQGIARHLKPGGRFVTINLNPTQPVDTFPMTRKYGYVKSTPGELHEGAVIKITWFLDDGRTFSVDDYYLSVATHERAFHAAGLHDVRWHPPRVSPDGEKEFGKEFWRDLLECKPVICIECRK